MVCVALVTDPLRSDADAFGTASLSPRNGATMSIAIAGPDVITPEGYQRLTAELEQLKTLSRREVADALRRAREDGSQPGENTAVADALDDAATLERRIEELSAVLARSQIAAPPPAGVIGIGQRVRVRLAPDATPMSCQLVGAPEFDPAAGRISVESPVGQALVGRRIGDRVEVETPGGSRTIEILDVGAHA
jgi:transcription elongation factor GreA